MRKVSYKLEKSGDFVIENYSRAKAFSSFFPGIAGLGGIPLWAFYVNRGQCISSFGTKDKDGAILEFLPANQAYNLTAVKGFRTFLKIRKKGRAIFYEPFKDNNASASQDITTRMIINPSKLEIEETNNSLGVRIKVTYITIPNESFAGLGRKVSINNISADNIEIELIDGIPQIVPYGMTEWHQKHMSRTIEAWMRVLNLDNNAPFYSLKINPKDSPELEFIERGNFYVAYSADRGKVGILEAIADPGIVFGRDGDISYPRIFFESGNHAKTGQRREGKTPCAFSHAKFAIKARRDRAVVSIIGNVKDVKSVNGVLKKIKANPAFFNSKLSENEDIIGRLQNSVFTKSSSDEFDFYARQTYLDNMLRGGVPTDISGSEAPFIFYAYARKHGDLERDYNAFLLQPSYYSQGNGAYRDINQNRRNDVLFNPKVRDENILTFMSAVQPDGFNPHLVEGISLSIKNKNALNSILKKHIRQTSFRNSTKSFLLKEFTPGDLLFFLEKEKILSKGKSGKLLKDILAVSSKKDVIRPGEGYWVDHWTYNIDLFENYLSCFPEKLKEILLDKKEFTFYDTYLRVVPRSGKYVYIDGKIRQYGSVVEDKEKRRLIDKRAEDKYKVRTKFGLGEIYRTNLLVKLICVIANKMSSLDPFGIGVEMEAGKPGWCDSLNGLPGIFGSSLCETFELKRLILFIKSGLAQSGIREDCKLAFPAEAADFLIDLEKLVRKNLASRSGKKDFLYWDSAWERKEQYREKVWPGFSGEEKAISVRKAKEILEVFLLKVETALKKGYSGKDRMTRTYYINEVKKFKFIRKKGSKKLNKDGLPFVKALSFGHRPLPLFLEGPMHAMRIMGREEAKSLYNAVRRSRIFDKKLNMYKINEPLGNETREIGRSAIFTPGWLENESIWLHMEYKYLVELLKAGLYEEFFFDLRKCLIAFQPPSRYGRSILENSSFIVSSAYPDRNIHGSGFVARLTGTTTEFLAMWLLMCLGKNPFALNKREKLCFAPKPAIPAWLFTKEKSKIHFYSGDGVKKEIILPKDIFAFCFAGRTLVVYHNPKRRNTFGEKAAYARSIALHKRGETGVKVSGGSVSAPFADKIREGYYDRIDIKLA